MPETIQAVEAIGVVFGGQQQSLMQPVSGWIDIIEFVYMNSYYAIHSTLSKWKWCTAVDRVTQPV